MELAQIFIFALTFAIAGIWHLKATSDCMGVLLPHYGTSGLNLRFREKVHDEAEKIGVKIAWVRGYPKLIAEVYCDGNKKKHRLLVGSLMNILEPGVEFKIIDKGISETNHN